jgi:hypothetical protein
MLVKAWGTFPPASLEVAMSHSTPLILLDPPSILPCSNPFSSMLTSLTSSTETYRPLTLPFSDPVFSGTEEWVVGRVMTRNWRKGGEGVAM